MKIRKTQGRLVHSPLSYAFQMLELGGSYIQKYNTVEQAYVPDRTLTPYLLKPQLTLSDPDGLIPTGDYTSRLVNVIWTLKSYAGETVSTLVAGTDYTVNSDTHALAFSKNILPDNLVHVSFKADYTDTRRTEVQHFTWEKDLTTIGEATWNPSLRIDVPSKMDLSPFKNRGQFAINAQLANGDTDLSDDQCVYQWQKFDGEAWVDIEDSDLWYVDGKDTQSITIDQDYLQRATLRCLAYAKDNADNKLTATTLLRRWYGQWDERIDLTQGRYVFANDTAPVVGHATVTNRQGDIANPERYFEIEIFVARKYTGWESVGYGVDASVQRTDLPDADPKFGVLVREWSAFVPIEMPDGSWLAGDDGEIIVAQFPTSERETG